MIGRETFVHLDLPLKDLQNLSPFSGVSWLVLDFLQLPSVKQKGVFIKPSKELHRSFNDGCGKNSSCMSCLRFFGRAVIQILLNYLIGFEKQTNSDVIQIKALANTDTSA